MEEAVGTRGGQGPAEDGDRLAIGHDGFMVLGLSSPASILQLPRPGIHEPAVGLVVAVVSEGE